MNYRHYSIIFSCILLFVFFFSFLAFNNRFAADDYYWMYLQKQHGILDSVKIFYDGLNGRWTANFMLGLMYVVLFKHTFLLGIFNILGLLLLFLAFYQLLAAINERVGRTPKKFLIALSSMFALFYFFITAGNGEIWFWICSAPSYLWNIIGFLFIASLLIKNNNSAVTWFLISLLSLYVGGSSEAYVAIYLLLEILAIVFVKNTSKTKYLLSLGFMAAGFIVNLLAPGNSVRAGWLPQKNVLHGIVFTLKTSYHMLADGWIDFSFAIICFIPFFILTGALLKDKLPLKLNPFKAISIFGILIIISFFPTCYFLSDDAPKRSCELAYFLIAVFVLISGINIGATLNMAESRIKVLGYTAPLLIGLLIIINSIVEIPIAVNYAKANDKRIALLQQVKDSYKGKLYKVEPLPNSGMLYSAEISTDTTYWANQHLKKGLGLGFDVSR